MKASCVFVVCLLAGVRPAPAQPLPHVRPLDHVAKLTMDRGRGESARFRALIEELEGSDVIVHVIAVPALPFGVIGTMRFVARMGETRYVRIDIAATSPPDLRVATLAHELEHACEVARSAATTHDAVRRLYRRIGSEVPGSRDAWETDGAQHAGAAVLAELRGLRRTARATDQ